MTPADIARSLTPAQLMERGFDLMEEVDGHRWGKFTASNVLGGLDWTVCFNCGMIRRADKKNSPCKGHVRVGPRNGGSR